MFTFNMFGNKKETLKVTFKRSRYLRYRKIIRGKDGGIKKKTRLQFVPATGENNRKLWDDRGVICPPEMCIAMECIISKFVGRRSGHDIYEEFVRGVTFCSPRDNFCPETGRRKSFKAAVRQFANLWVRKNFDVYKHPHEKIQEAKKSVRTYLWKEYKKERSKHGYTFSQMSIRKLRRRQKKEEGKKQHAGI